LAPVLLVAATVVSFGAALGVSVLVFRHVFGLGIALSAFVGRTGAGSIFLAVITAALLAGSVAMPKDISTHWMRVEWTPRTAAAVPERFDLGTGVGTLDLTHLGLTKGQTVTTTAEVGAGQLKVIVPRTRP
ncbi:hypothetical protein ABZV25_13100, partial [Micrococcus luteus]